MQVSVTLFEVSRLTSMPIEVYHGVVGHHLAYKAGVLHSDVSDGNVMLARSKAFNGFIHDFDMASFIDSSVDGGTMLPTALKALSERQLRMYKVC